MNSAMAMGQVVCFLFVVLATWHSAMADYEEKLLLRPSEGGDKVLAHFHFVVEDDDQDSGGTLVPLVMRQILSKYDVHAFHLTFVVGSYDHKRYGSSSSIFGGPELHAPFGARLQVQLRENAARFGVSRAESASSLNDRWRSITAELGGAFSASLNQMDHTMMTWLLAPELNRTSRPDADKGMGSYVEWDESKRCDSCVFLHGSLAREELCTENLTPWLKMLPCRAHAGLGKLIDPIRLLSGEYLSLSIFASKSKNGKVKIQQQLTVVQKTTKGNHFSLADVFLEPGNRAVNFIEPCTLAKVSQIVTVPSGKHQKQRVLDLHAVDQVAVNDRWNVENHPAMETESGINLDLAKHTTVHRFVTGYGQVHGGIAVQFENQHPSCSIQIEYQDVIPWYLRLYFNTFHGKMIQNGEELSVDQSILRSYRFIPAELRGRPNQLRVGLKIPPMSSFVFSIQLEKVFLRLSEHPPDANRGFDIAAGVALVSYDDSCSTQPSGHLSPTPRLTLYTSPLLVPLPTPDFSMPYNVITMTSTVVAFFVGNMLNTLLRKAPRFKRLMAKGPHEG